MSPLIRRLKTYVMVGNPNAGKTTLFNALTGLRQKVANYPGVTVEKKEGRVLLSDGSEAQLIDLPGTYSLTAVSPDERIVAETLLGTETNPTLPDLVLCVVDASNLERNLFLVSQLLDLEIPLVVALNMVDAATQAGISVNSELMELELGVPVIPVVASQGKGIRELRTAITHPPAASTRTRQWRSPSVFEEEHDELSGLLQEQHRRSKPAAFHEALALLSVEEIGSEEVERYHPEIIAHVRQDHDRLSSLQIDREAVAIEGRYEWSQAVCSRVIEQRTRTTPNFSELLDRFFMHKVFGFVAFIGIMAMMFQAIFTWAELPMNAITSAITFLGTMITQLIPPGDVRRLVVDGALGGVGAVVTFLPQIMLLFFFLGILEDSGYMARAAFIMDRVMRGVGLHGRSFIPLLGSFACAIPGVMATRTIENRKDRLVTMLVAPLMSCSARLPVYALMIAAFIPQRTVGGMFSLPGLTLVAMYLLGLVVALLMARLFKSTLLKSETPAFVMEMPPYRIPSLRSLLTTVWERSWSFVKRAGTFILGVSIILWFLASYPKIDHATPSQQLEHSFAGQAGKFIEPVIAPLGFNWKIGIGLIGSLLQREVFVSTMGTIYNITDSSDNGVRSLAQHLHSDVDPSTGAPAFSVLTAICLMVYYVLALQCMSTVAVVKRESNSWRWPLFLIGYMTILSWVGTFAVYRIGLLLQQ